MSSWFATFCDWTLRVTGAVGLAAQPIESRVAPTATRRRTLVHARRVDTNRSVLLKARSIYDPVRR